MAKYNSVKGKLPKGGGKGMSGDALVGRVSQATIDDIKKMGMTNALKLAGVNGSTAGGLAREFQEGVRRMYGARRLAEAKAKYAPKNVAVSSKSPSMPSRGPMVRIAEKTANKPTAAQLAVASTRAGVKVQAMTASKSKPKTASQVAADKKAAAARAAAAKAAIKKAGGRTA